MNVLLTGALVGFPVATLAMMGGYAYYDAPNHDMNPKKWGAIAFFIPFFGFFAYLFERDERTPDDHNREEMFADGPFQIHKSRADDTPLARTPVDDDGGDADEDET
jgi:hypothetical protein